MEVSAGVADLDAEAVGGRVEDEREPEAAAGQAAVEYGIGGEFRDDEFGTLGGVLEASGPIAGPRRT
ncbi:hypothetical protein [Streptomyces sp. MH13]|uniref:hypothetical protein n=1 Tax=unclassified Streptomyces TaxID=2593676 RepID=UPI003CEF222C